MAAVPSKHVLSGSTDGRAIKVAQTATPGTTIHTGSSVATDIDEIWIWANNTDTVARDLTIEWGGVTDPDDLEEVTIQPSGTASSMDGATLVIPGWVIQGNASTALICTSE